MNALTAIDLKDLHFDPENPRLPNYVKNKKDEEVLRYLLLECNLIELMLSIGEHGFFEGEPLLVVARKEGGFTVVEGNRRLGALKLLQKDVVPPVKPSQVLEARAITKETPTSIPVMIFPHRDSILSYLGYRHITGIKEWDALAKARYLQQLRERHGGDDAEAHKALAKEIGSKASHVARLLTGLKVLEIARDQGILSKIKLEEDDIQFSLLTTGLSYTNISSYVGLNSPTDVMVEGLKIPELEEFFIWVFDKTQGTTKLGESRNFEKLARIVNNEQALIEFRRGATIEAADIFTSGPLEALRNLLREIEERLDQAITTLSFADGLGGHDLEQSNRIRKSAIVLSGAIGGLINPTDPQ